MTYVRTKDGIYKVILVSPLGFVRIDKRDGTYPDVFEKDTIEQADTIDELTDEAVFFDKDNVPHYKSKEGNIWYLGASLFTESLRFGIFTDKGLIYVAKMNDKGELELL